ncbi:MAG: hypothetical protein LBK44_03225 [Spirochaetales bacterium]|jgi:hypothetical protein|nr:hypothetical protein [Spirochaetales bacterium]
MRAGIFLLFLVTGFITPFIYAEDTLYKIDDGYVVGTGITGDGQHLMLDIFFSFECLFEKNTRISSQRLYAEKVREYLSRYLRSYTDNIYLPQHTSKDFTSCQYATEFYTGFLDYILEKEELNNTRIIKLKIKKK